MAMYSLSTALSLLALLSLAQCEVTPPLNADSLNSTLDLTVVNVHPHSVELSWQVDTQVSGNLQLAVFDGPENKVWNEDFQCSNGSCTMKSTWGEICEKGACLFETPSVLKSCTRYRLYISDVSKNKTEYVETVTGVETQAPPDHVGLQQIGFCTWGNFSVSWSSVDSSCVRGYRVTWMGYYVNYRSGSFNTLQTGKKDVLSSKTLSTHIIIDVRDHYGENDKMELEVTVQTINKDKTLGEGHHVKGLFGYHDCVQVPSVEDPFRKPLLTTPTPTTPTSTSTSSTSATSTRTSTLPATTTSTTTEKNGSDSAKAGSLLSLVVVILCTLCTRVEM